MSSNGDQLENVINVAEVLIQLNFYDFNAISYVNSNVILKHYKLNVEMLPIVASSAKQCHQSAFFIDKNPI